MRGCHQHRPGARRPATSASCSSYAAVTSRAGWPGRRAAGRCRPRSDDRGRRPPGPRRPMRRISSRGGRPVQAHAALGGVHRLGDAEAVRPQVAAEGERGVPVDGGRGARDVRPRAGRRRRARRRTRPGWWRRRRRDGRGRRRPRSRCAPPAGQRDGASQRSSGTSTPAALARRSAGPARRAARRARRRGSPTGTARPATTWRRNSSHCTLKPLSNSSLSGTSCHCVAEVLGGRQVRVPHRLGGGGAVLDAAVAQARRRRCPRCRRPGTRPARRGGPGPPRTS